jgi:uncharacterized membrane protein
MDIHWKFPAIYLLKQIWIQVQFCFFNGYEFVNFLIYNNHKYIQRLCIFQIYIITICFHSHKSIQNSKIVRTCKGIEP